MYIYAYTYIYIYTCIVSPSVWSGPLCMSLTALP